MTQTRKGSLAEAATSTAIGYLVALCAQAAIYPLFDIHASGGQHVAIAALFTVVSLVRGYAVRRMFNAIGKRDTSQDLYASYLIGRHSARRQFVVDFPHDEHIGHNVAACWNCVHHTDGRCTRTSAVVDPVHACFSFRNKHNGDGK